MSDITVSKKKNRDRGIPLFAFQWTVPAEGFRWEQARVLDKPSSEGEFSKKPEWVLTSGLDFGETYMLRRYAPLTAYPALFRTFADLQLENRDAMLAFANQYGELGIGRFLHVASPNNANSLRGVTGETFQEWAENISRMREAVSFWELLRARDVAGLSKFLRWQPAERGAGSKIQVAEGWMYDSHPDLPRSKMLFPRRHFHALLPEFHQVPITKDDILTAAFVLVQGWVNQALDGKAAPRLLHDPGAGQLVMLVVPSNLLAAMWLQLAHAIAGNKQYRACRECGNWFEISSADDARTARRMFCSEPCKSRDYRRRKEQAQALAAKRRTPKQIAEELHTDVETVRGWVQVTPTKKRKWK